MQEKEKKKEKLGIEGEEVLQRKNTGIKEAERDRYKQKLGWMGKKGKG